jgi:CheY-like chemotaxis protein
MADVLIVDDNADIAECLESLLTLEGHGVRVASDGEQGLLALVDRFPDLVVLDIDMPVLDGPGMACRMLLQDCGRELIPIILSSADSQLTEIAARIGTPYSLRKPFDVSDLTKLVDRVLAERRAPQPPLAGAVP